MRTHKRKSPIRHKVRSHLRRGKLVHSYMRGTGVRIVKPRRLSRFSLSPRKNLVIMARDFEDDSLFKRNLLTLIKRVEKNIPVPLPKKLKIYGWKHLKNYTKITGDPREVAFAVSELGYAHLSPRVVRTIEKGRIDSKKDLN